MRTDTEVRAALSTIFDADTGIYRERGFRRRVGYGRRHALVHIDLANAWTRPGHAFSCDGMDTIIPAVQALNEAGRADIDAKFGDVELLERVLEYLAGIEPFESRVGAGVATAH